MREREFFYPNRFAHRYLTCTAEICGKNGMTALLHLAKLSDYIEHPPPDNLVEEFNIVEISQLHYAFEEMGRPRMGRGLAWRTGMCVMHNHIFDFPQVPFSQSDQGKVALADALPVIIQVMTQYLSEPPSIVENETTYAFSLETCPACYGRNPTLREKDWTQSPPCKGVCGMVEGGLWRLTGARYDVKEVACIAREGSMCEFVVEKQISHKQWS